MQWKSITIIRLAARKPRVSTGLMRLNVRRRFSFFFFFFFTIEKKWELILNIISSTKSANSDKIVVLESTSWFLRLFAVSVLISNGIYIIYTYYILTMLVQLFQTFLYVQVDCMIPDLYNNCCWTMYTTVFADV